MYTTYCILDVAARPTCLIVVKTILEVVYITNFSTDGWFVDFSLTTTLVRFSKVHAAKVRCKPIFNTSSLFLWRHKVSFPLFFSWGKWKLQSILITSNSSIWLTNPQVHSIPTRFGGPRWWNSLYIQQQWVAEFEKIRVSVQPCNDCCGIIL